MRAQKTTLLAFALFLSACVSAYAGSVTVTFNFNSLGSGATAAQISTYMNGVLTAAGCAGCSVTVSGAVADQTYTGDGHVVGQNNGTVFTPVTLGTTNGATNNSLSAGTFNSAPSAPITYDTFLANTDDNSNQISNQITMKFSGFTINGSASFNYEIFPDGTSQQPPDMIFDAGNGTNDSAVTSFGTGGTQYGVTPRSTPSGTAGTDGSNTKSSAMGTESNAQYIGTWAGSLTNDTELDFIDWPATIGVDNLNISYNNSSVPEPASIALLGTLVVLLTKKLRKV